MSPKIKFDKNQIAEFCRRHQIIRLAVFGSVLRDDFRPESDVDVLVEFLSEANFDLYDFVALRDELKAIFGREVDLVEKEALRNPFRRRAILENQEVLYAA
jgi:predicted nucleotidyltransferase